MPANVTPEFGKKYREFQDARTTTQKIRVLKELIPLAPKHKGGENLRAQLKKKLARLSDRQESEKRTKKGTSRKGIKKIAPLIVIIGPPNSGKTTFFKNFTGEGKPGKHPYSTQEAQTAVGKYRDAKLQFIDCPSFDFSYANNADVVLLTIPDEKLQTKFKNKLIIIAERKSPNKILREAWRHFGLIRVYTETGDEPMLLKKDAIIKDAAKDIHKSFVSNFEWARVKRSGKLYRVGLEFPLKEGDIVWIKAHS